MRVVFADNSRQLYDYQDVFVGKPQASAAMLLLQMPNEVHRG